MNKVNGMTVYEADDPNELDVYSQKIANEIKALLDANKYDDTAIKKDITNIKLEQITQNDDIEKNSNNITKIQNECNRIINQLNSKVVSGTEITLKDTADIRLKNFDIDATNTSNLVVSNKNLLEFSEQTGNGITFSKNRITIINPTGYLYASNTLVGGNKFLSGKRVIFTTVTNGTISNISGTLDFTIHTNKTQYRFQKKHTIGTYNDDIKSEVWQFADDEYITSILVYTTGATCNLTIDVQVSIIDAEFIEHQGAEFQITSTNKDEIIKQIIENGTYQNITHFYTTDEAHANMNLEYYQNLDNSLNKYKEQLPQGQAGGTEISLNDSSNLELTNFSIAVNNSAHLVISNKNLLKFADASGHGITYNKNRITIINPDFYLVNRDGTIFNNKFLSGKTVTFVYVINGEVTGNNYVDIIFTTTKNTYRVQNPMQKGTFNNTKFAKTITLASDEYFTQVQVWTAGTTCNLTVDLQVEISNTATDLVEHQSAEFDITTDNLLAVVNQIKRNGTYKNVTHFYTTDETHPSINLEYYKDLETLFNNLIQANTQAESEG